MLAVMRSRFSLLGTTIVLRWIAQLTRICPGVAPCLSATASRAGSATNVGIVVLVSPGAGGRPITDEAASVIE